MNTKEKLLYASVVLNFACVLLFILIYNDVKWKHEMMTNYSRIKLRSFSKIPAEDKDEDIENESYILNLPGCRIKRYRAFDNLVMPFFKETPDLECGPSFAFARKREILVNKSAMAKHFKIDVKAIQCSLFTIHRYGNGTDNRYVSEFVREIKKLRFKATDDFVKITCFADKTKIIYEDFFALIQEKKEIEEKLKKKEEKNPRKWEEKFNVIFIGLDSVSRNNFIRHFPKTYSYLQETADVLDYRGYIKLGRNTFPSLLPLFTGEFQQKQNGSRGPFDNFSMIWKNYSANGYVTLFGEDYPGIAIFNFNKKGFFAQPTDYYMRPFHLAVRNSVMKQTSKKFCFNSRPGITVILQWLKDFLDHYAHKPTFSLIHLTELTHDRLNSAGYADNPMLTFFKWYNQINHRNRTFLFFYSDHGMRLGRFRKTMIGDYESSLPFLYLLLPTEFRNEFPQLYHHLHLNQHRLVTMLDVHELLKDILYFGYSPQPREASPAKHNLGVSLFDTIPINRTCENAGIPIEYCKCYDKKLINVNSSIVGNNARTIVDKINEFTKDQRHKCALLSLGNVTSAFYYVYYNSSRSRNMTTYIISLRTLPNDGKFQGTVLCEEKDENNCTITSERTNSYGTESDCVSDSEMKIYCYCFHRTKKRKPL